MIKIKIGEYILDKEQESVVLDNSKVMLVIAGAGAGKSLTIIGKVRYLVSVKKVDESKILCISFTNEATKNLKDKIYTLYKYNIQVKTFHKLALDIIGHNYKIVDDNYLDEIIYIFFENIVFINHNLIKIVLKELKIFYNKFNYLKKYQEVLTNKRHMDLMKDIKKFINLFKTNNKDINEFLRLFKYKKYYNFLLLTYSIFVYYTSELKSQNLIDFDDIIALAIKKIKTSNIDYKYIIVDEYQDTSLSKYKLLKSIVDKTNAHLMCVGDDWQSIYGFSSCDLKLFTNFSKLFLNSKILYLNHTYRNSLELINIAGNFIMKNKMQMKKKLVSLKTNANPLKFIYYKNIKEDFTKIILNKSEDLMILGRNNFDINKYLDTNIFNIDKEGCIYFKENNEYIARYLTVHKAKGLESNNVILINLENNIYGFPNKIKSKKVFNLLLNKTNNFYYEEERRLFYVALTRSKNNVYFYLNKYNESIFIKELKRDYKKFIDIKKRID